MAANKPLAELEAGDTIKTNEGRAEWLYIVNIGDRDGDTRHALIEQAGGRLRGRRFYMTLHDYAHGWITR
jgi:hypothetical protein